MPTAQTTTAQCGRCGRTLRSATSVAAGYGPTCKAKITKAAKASTDKNAQVAKALELIETGAIVAIHHGRAFRVVASNGVDRYSTTSAACSCPAGVHGRRCYHQVAAELVAAIPVNPFATAA